MKMVLGIIAASAFAIAALSAPVAAAPADAACFGQVHKAVNGGFLSGAGIDNVGMLVQSFDDKGQGKNATARSLC